MFGAAGYQHLLLEWVCNEAPCTAFEVFLTGMANRVRFCCVCRPGMVLTNTLQLAFSGRLFIT